MPRGRGRTLWIEHRSEAFPGPLRRSADALRGRPVVVPRLEMLPVECVVRGFLAGSGVKEYRSTGAVCGVKLPAGARESAAAPGARFTPPTEAAAGRRAKLPRRKGPGPIGPRAAGPGRRLHPA